MGKLHKSPFKKQEKRVCSDKRLDVDLGKTDEMIETVIERIPMHIHFFGGDALIQIRSYETLDRLDRFSAKDIVVIIPKLGANILNPLAHKSWDDVFDREDAITDSWQHADDRLGIEVGR